MSNKVDTAMFYVLLERHDNQRKSKRGDNEVLKDVRYKSEAKLNVECCPMPLTTHEPQQA